MRLRPRFAALLTALLACLPFASGQNQSSRSQLSFLRAYQMLGLSRAVTYAVTLLAVLATLTITGVSQNARISHARPAVTTVSPDAPVTTYAGNGYDGYAGDGGPAIQAELELGDYFSGPYGDMAFDSAGNLYFADGLEDGRIRMVDAGTGIITTVAGGGTACTGFCGDGGPATLAHFGPLYSVTVDSSGNLYIAADSMILRVDASTGILTVVAGSYTCSTGLLGPSCRGNNGYTGDGGPATSATFYGIAGVVVDKAGNLYVTDQTYYSSNTVVREVAANTGIVTTIAGRGAGCAGQTDTVGDGCPSADATLQYATSLALDAGGNLYISDTSLNEGGDRIRRIDHSTGIISTAFAGGNAICSGATDNLGDGCPTTEAILSPAGIALDSSEDIYIGEPGQCRVREVDTSGIIHLVAGVNNGSVGSCGYSGLTSSTAKFARAGSLTFDASGNMYVADDENYVIRKVGFGSTSTQIETTTALTSSANPQGKGANVTFTADVKPSSGTEIPTGTVTFTVDGAVAAAATLDSTGHASYATSTLIPNIHTIQVGYGGDAHNAASISDVLSETILLESVAATPSFSPAAGTYTSAQTVTISDATSGATIYYTTNGSTPTTSSTKYTGAITVSARETISAIAVASGFLNSSVATATYTINLPAATPVFSPAVGTYTSAQRVTITDSTTGAAIYYTVNGTMPTTSSMKYTGAITVSATETIEAIAVAAGYANSAVASAKYTIVPSTTAELQFIPSTPCRIADTRNAAGAFGGPELAAAATRTFNVPQSSCGIPATAVAYSLNVTVVPIASLGYLTIWPAGLNQPTVSTLNSDGRVKANATITPAGTNGGVSVYASDATQFILDIDGYFVPAGTNTSGLEFFPLTPCRIADTRNTTGALGGPSLTGGVGRAFPVQSSPCGIPSTAKAYSLNITAVPHGSLGYLTTWPTGQSQPVVSTLNATTGVVTANAAIVPAGTGGDISIVVSDTADVLLDVNGYFAPPATGGLSLYTVTPCRVIDTRNGAGAFDGTLAVPVHGSTCAPPVTAQAYVLNATVVPTASLSYLTLWAAGGAQPIVSTLNATDGAVTSNMAIVPTTNGAIDAFATDSTNLLLDLSSYFAP
jgi:Chitobiase/beta-hexosaminidase C-terminal domain/Bacterial Ig-like domain (group 3)